MSSVAFQGLFALAYSFKMAIDGSSNTTDVYLSSSKAGISVPLFKEQDAKSEQMTKHNNASNDDVCFISRMLYVYKCNYH